MVVEHKPFFFPPVTAGQNKKQQQKKERAEYLRVLGSVLRCLVTSS